MKNKRKKIMVTIQAVIIGMVMAFGGSMPPAQAASSVLEYQGHYYMFVDSVVDAATAEYMCDMKGAHLVTFTSAAEEAFVKEKLSGDTDIWLGAKKVKNKWKWVTGESFSYRNWHEGQPSNYDDEDYLSVWEGSWDDCTVTKNGFSDGNAYVMEWDSKDAYQAYINKDTNKMVKYIPGATLYNGHYYKYYALKSTWKDASAKCKKLGGYLVTITDKKENSFAYRLCGKSNTWIGLNDAKKEGKYVWTTKERTDYRNFGKDVNDDFNSTEDYMGFFNGSKWNDYTNEGSMEGQLGFICEWDGSNPVILTAVKSAYTVKVQKKVSLKYQSYPVKTKVTFKSAKPKIASVNKKGVITGKKPGKTKVTIKAGKKTVKVTVTVKK